jgi:hypothetical protein
MKPSPTRSSRDLAACCIAIVATTLAAAHPADPDGDGDPPALLPVAAPAPGKKEAKPANSVKITIEGDFRRIQSNGWPDHAPGEFPRRGNPNAPTPQKYSFRVPVKPVAAESPQRRGGWWWGVALNGVPFEPGTGETWNNDPRSDWRYEAATGFLNLGLDEHNAHVQPNGSYHYHALPTGLVEGLGGDGKKMLLIGWAADGFPVYTGRAHADATDPKSALRKMKSGYQLKKGPRPEQEDGPGGNHDGRFSQDFEFVKGLGDLDECNGRSGVTPEFPEGTYYYCVGAEFPFVGRMWHGTPDDSFNKGDRPPGGPGRPAPIGGAPRGILEDGPGGGPGPTDGPGAGRGPMPMPVIEALDLNHDRVIDAAELAKASESLKKLDKNGDGQLSAEEFRPAPGGGMGRPPR